MNSKVLLAIIVLVSHCYVIETKSYLRETYVTSNKSNSWNGESGGNYYFKQDFFILQIPSFLKLYTDVSFNEVFKHISEYLIESIFQLIYL